MDEDGNDELTMEEIKHGYDHNDMFRNTLEKMEIRRADLDIVWTILDSDKSGTITSKEFVTQVYKMKSSDTQFMLAYVKYYITEIRDKLRDDLKKIQESVDKETSTMEKEITKFDQDIIKMENVESKIEGKFSISEKLQETPQEEVEVKWDGNVSNPPLQMESLQLLFEQTQSLKVETELAAKSGSPAQEYTEMLTRLHGVWQQCVVSIDDTGKRHKNLTNLLASQAQQLGAMIRRLSGGSSSAAASVGSSTPLLEPKIPDNFDSEVKACWVCGHRTQTPV
jgi:hypothetical protein